VIGYHYSPRENQASILKHGLLVPLRHPKLVTPVTCSEGHRNPHISLARTPVDAWSLSGGFLRGRIIGGDRPLYWTCPEHWDLYQVELPRHSYRAYGLELQSSRDIPKSRVIYVGSVKLESGVG